MTVLRFVAVFILTVAGAGAFAQNSPSPRHRGWAAVRYTVSEDTDAVPFPDELGDWKGFEAGLRLGKYLLSVYDERNHNDKQFFTETRNRVTVVSLHVPVSRGVWAAVGVGEARREATYSHDWMTVDEVEHGTVGELAIEWNNVATGAFVHTGVRAGVRYVPTTVSRLSPLLSFSLGVNL